MTDLFKCPKSGTQCCAPKSLIREHIDRKNGIEPSQNETLVPPPYVPPYRSTPLPTFNIPPHTQSMSLATSPGTRILFFIKGGNKIELQLH